MSAPLCFCHHDMHCFSSWQAGSSLGGLLGGGTQAGRGTNAGAAGGVTDTMEAAALLEVLNGGVRAVVVEGGPGPAAQKAPDPEPPSAPAPNRPAAAAAAAADDDEQQREVRHQICSTFYIAALCSLGVYQNRVHIPQDVTKASHPSVNLSTHSLIRSWLPWPACWALLWHHNRPRWRRLTLGRRPRRGGTRHSPRCPRSQRRPCQSRLPRWVIQYMPQILPRPGIKSATEYSWIPPSAPFPFPEHIRP